MAEGWLRHFGGDDFEIFSAGVMANGVHPLAIKHMADAGVDITSQISQTVDEFLDQEFDIVVTVCDYARQSCPVFPGAPRTIHHPFEDPQMPYDSNEPDDDVFLRVRDQIRQWSQTFVQEHRES